MSRRRKPKLSSAWHISGLSLVAMAILAYLALTGHDVSTAIAVIATSGVASHAAGGFGAAPDVPPGA